MDMMERNEEKKCIQAYVGEKSAMGESTTEFNLPDYQPEMKRLLRVCTTVSPAEKYIASDRVELSGNVEYTVIYAGNDGQIYSVSQNEEYGMSLPLELSSEYDWDSGIVCDLQILPESPTARLMGPRKVSAKLRYRAKAKLYANRCLQEKIEGAEGQTLHRLQADEKSLNLFLGRGESLSLTEELIPEGGTEDFRVIFAEAGVLPESATSKEDEVECAGKVYFKLLCTKDGEELPEPLLLQKAIPFTASATVEGATPGDEATFSGTCQNLRVTVEEGKIICEAELVCDAKAQRNETFVYTKDIYSETSNREITYGKMQLLQASGCLHRNFSLDQQVNLQSIGCKREQNLVDLSCNCVQFDLENANGKTALVGKCKMQAIMMGTDDYSVQEFELPLRLSLEKEIGEDSDLTVTSVLCRGKAEGENLYCHAELSVCAAMREKKTVEPMVSANFFGTVEKESAGYRICYPGKQDSLWNVAKKYHVSCEALIEKNALPVKCSWEDEKSLSDVKFLMI